MAEKHHQSSGSEYQIRIDGKPVAYPMIICPAVMNEWLDLCHENPDCYVDIVSVHTEIVMSQHTYTQVKKHFGGINSSTGK